MATVPTLTTQAAGAPAKAAQFAAEIQYAAGFALRPPQARVYRTAALSTLTTGTWFLPNWDTNAYDTDGMHTSANILTVQTPGYYRIDGMSVIPPGAGLNLIDLRKNAAGSVAGGTEIGASQVNDAYNRLPSIVLPFNAADTVEMFIQQTSGSTQAMTVGAQFSFFQMTLVSLL